MGRSHALVGLGVMALLVCTRPGVAADAKPKQMVVITFDFDTSNMEDEDLEYSEKLGEMFWKKIERKERARSKPTFIVPESMLDVRQVCKRYDFKPSIDTPLSKMADFIKNTFDAHVGIWGKLNRLDYDKYEIWIRIVDFSGEEPEIIVDGHGVAENVHEIPHLHVKDALMALYKELAPDADAPDPDEEARWRDGPNLVRNGDFERISPAGHPMYWDPFNAQGRRRAGDIVKVVPDPDGKSGRCIMFEMTKAIGDTYGVLYYSFYFPVVENAKYRFQYRWRTDGPTPKVFLKAYDEMVEVSQDGGRKLFKQWRECYRSQQQPKGEKNQWNTHTEDFTPKHTKYTPRKMRVMLYGYIDAGTMHFDDVVIKLIKPAPPSLGPKERRHSLETKVKLKEYEREHTKYRGHKAGSESGLKDVSTGENAPKKAPKKAGD